MLAERVTKGDLTISGHPKPEEFFHVHFDLVVQNHLIRITNSVDSASQLHASNWTMAHMKRATTAIKQ